MQNREMQKYIYKPLTKEADIIEYLEHFGEVASTYLINEVGDYVEIECVNRHINFNNHIQLYEVRSNIGNIGVNTNKFKTVQEAVTFAIELIGGRENIFDWR